MLRIAGSVQPGGHRLRIGVCQLGSLGILSRSGDRCDPEGRRKHAGPKFVRDGYWEGLSKDKVLGKRTFQWRNLPGSRP
jgi:hypothetical protein